MKHETAAERHERQLARARSSGGFFQFSRDHVRLGLLKKIEACFLQDLINRRQMIYEKSLELEDMGKTPLIDEGGYFKCTVKYLANPKYMIWSEDEQKRLLPILIEKGLIKVKKTGLPPTRKIRINFQVIEDRLDELEEALFPMRGKSHPLMSGDSHST